MDSCTLTKDDFDSNHIIKAESNDFLYPVPDLHYGYKYYIGIDCGIVTVYKIKGENDE